MARPPFEITQEVIDKAESLATNGLTKEEIAGCLGISYVTLNEKTKMFPAFLKAINDGKCKGIAMMANNLVKLAKAGNGACNIFYLKARAKWKENDDEIIETLQKDMQEIKALALKSMQMQQDKSHNAR